MVLGIQPRPLYILGKHSTTEQYPSPVLLSPAMKQNLKEAPNPLAQHYFWFPVQNFDLL